MDDLLKKHTSLSIQIIIEGMGIQPGVIYLNPPDKNVALQNGHFRLSPINHSNRGFFRVDHFFRSLADDQMDNSICMILSGTGSDGTLGLREIKSAGGLTMAQLQDQAGYGGMPQNAISTGLVDVVLSAEQMADTLMRYVQHPHLNIDATAQDDPFDYNEVLGEIFQILYQHKDHDFTNYKLNTIQRRIERRMAVHHIGSLNAYRKFLKEHQSEVDTLFKELLISVTSFFRDPKDFQALKESVIPDLLSRIPAYAPLRVWVPACATGEEAYSIAMIITEACEEQGEMTDCKIFASDIDQGAIDFARSGLYPESVVNDVSQERLQRFFVKEGQYYRVKKQLRDMVVFASQNLIKDPPFSKLDLISCRNVLIYMNQKMRRQLLSVFYYSLNQSGYLFLGSSESVSGFENQFEALNDDTHLFQKLNGSLNVGVNLPPIPSIRTSLAPVQQASPAHLMQTDVRSKAERNILDHFTYPCVVINSNYDILYFYGNTERYLTTPRGKATLNLLNMARTALQYKLVPALREASQNNYTTHWQGLQLPTETNYLHFDIVVQPITQGYDQS